MTECPWCDHQPLKRVRARFRAGGRPVRVCSVCRGVLP